MSPEDDDRESKYANFEKEIFESLNPASASGVSEGEDAPYGVCFQNQMYHCGPACVAFLPFDTGPDGQPLLWGERCEVLVSKRLQARALVNIERMMHKMVKPDAAAGPPPPPSPARAKGM